MNEEVHYLHRPEDVRLIPGTAQAVRMFHEAGFRVVVVTNQAGVARGYYTEADVEALHAYMNRLLMEEGARVITARIIRSTGSALTGPYAAAGSRIRECLRRRSGIWAEGLTGRLRL